MVTSEHLFQTIVQFDKTIVLPRKLQEVYITTVFASGYSIWGTEN